MKLDEVLAATEQKVSIGTVADLDALPFPDWSIFPYWQFQVGYDFSKFPTAYVQSSRGCTLSCTYCPYIILENKVRTRSPALVAEEIRRNMEEYDFRSFKFRDPLFGARRKHVEELAEQIGKLPRKIQFSVESRIELLSREVLEDAARRGADVGHGRHRNPQPRDARQIQAGPDQGRQAEPVRGDVPQPGDSRRRRLHDRLSRKTRGRRFGPCCGTPSRSIRSWRTSTSARRIRERASSTRSSP